MRKSDIVKHVATETPVTRVTAQMAVYFVFSEIADALARGEQAVIRGFGRFTMTSHAARPGRTPAARESTERPTSTSVFSKASKALKEAVR